MGCIESRESVATLSEIDHWTLHNNYTKHQCLRRSSGQGVMCYIVRWVLADKAEHNYNYTFFSFTDLSRRMQLTPRTMCLYEDIFVTQYTSRVLHEYICTLLETYSLPLWKMTICFEGHTLKSVIRNTIWSKLHSKMIHTIWNN